MITDKQSFVKEANLIHNFEYDYDKFIYTKSVHKSLITCRKHGDFLQSANKHLQGRGCPECAKVENGKNKTRLALIGIEDKLRGVHGDKYTYPDLSGVRRKDKIEVTCKVHGSFISTLDQLLRGNGCSKCGANSDRVKMNGCSANILKRAEEMQGWVHFYIACLYNSDERFIKIGVTKNFNYRRSTLKGPYKVFPIGIFQMDAERAVLIERALKEGIRKFLPHLCYTPKFKFGGYTECFTTGFMAFGIETCVKNGWLTISDFEQFKD